MKTVLLLIGVLLFFSVSSFGQTSDVEFGSVEARRSYVSFDTFIGWTGSSFSGQTWNNSELGDTQSTNVIGSGLDLGVGQSYLDQNGLVLSWDFLLDYGQLGGAVAPSTNPFRFYSVTGLKGTGNLAVGYHWVHNESGDLRVTSGYFVSVNGLISSQKSSDGNSWLEVTDSKGQIVGQDVNVSQGVSLALRYDFKVDEDNALGLQLRDSIAVFGSNYFNNSYPFFYFYRDLQVSQVEVNLVWSSFGDSRGSTSRTIN